MENGGNEMDLSRQLKTAIATGSLLFGQRQTLDACARGDARLVLLAANCPSDYIDDLRAQLQLQPEAYCLDNVRRSMRVLVETLDSFSSLQTAQATTSMTCVLVTLK